MTIWRCGLVAVLAALAACSGRNPDRQIQLCVRDEQGLADFRAILIEISERHDLEFFDSSVSVERDLRALDSELVGKYPIRHYHVHDKSEGVEISATNLGLGRYQTTLSYDLRNDKQRVIAEDLTVRLTELFDIELPAAGKGAFPLEDCPD